MAQCPLCGQTLPKGVDRQEIQRQLEKITTQARAKERRELERDFDERLHQRLEAEGKRLRQEARREAQSEVAEVRRRAEKEKSQKAREIARIRKDSEKQQERTARIAAQTATRENRAELERVRAAREKDRARYETERAQLLNKLDLLTRKLEKQSGEQLGAEAEVDLLAQLRAAFPGDRIEPIRRGVKGADIVHDVIDESKRLGRIIWESKNVSTWSNRFISQAKQYQTQYETQHL
jgi:hypothetical protein